MQIKRISNSGVRPVFAEPAKTLNVRLPVGVNYASGTVLGQLNLNSNVARNDVKTITITGTPTGGTWSFSFAGTTSATLAYNAAAAAVQTAVNNVFGSGNCTVTGGPGPGTPWVLTFGGIMANVNVASFTVAGTFTGGTSPAIAIVNTTPGTAGAGQFSAYNNGASDGTEVARLILQDDYNSDVNGGMKTEAGDTNSPYSPAAYYEGAFLCSQLTGLDAAGLADLGNLIAGSAITDTGAIIRIK